MKQCISCHLELDDSHFRLHKGKYRLSTCKKCDNRKGKQLYRKRRACLVEKLNAVKLEMGCVLCGWKQFPSGLDLHHVNDDKNETIANLLNRGQFGMGFICREISKCVVVCACCHRGIHAGEVILPAGTKPMVFHYK